MSDTDIQQFVETYITPAIKALVELLSKSEIQEDIDLIEELKQLI